MKQATNNEQKATTEVKQITADDFVKTVTVDGEEKTETLAVIDAVDAKGNKLKHVLLSGGSVATIREGKGKDVERAAMESAGEQSKYMSSMMSACTSIDGKPVSMYDLAELRMKDYTAIQVAFAEINF